MRLTPLDIRKQEFTKSFRGFDPEEVQAFLQMVANQWGEMQDERRRLEEKLRSFESKIQHYEKVEEALQEALQVARETTHRTIANAEAKAKNIIEEAKIKAEGIQRDAKTDHDRLKREASQLSGRRNEITARLRSFLLSELELLAHFDGEDPYGFIKLMPSEQGAFRRGTSNVLPQTASSSDTPPPVQEPEPDVPQTPVSPVQEAPQQPDAHTDAPPIAEAETLSLEATLPLEPIETPLDPVLTFEPPASPSSSSVPVDIPPFATDEDIVLEPPLDEPHEAKAQDDTPLQDEEPLDSHPSWTVNSVLTPEPQSEETSIAAPSQEEEPPKQKLSKEMEMLQRFLNQLD